MEIARWRSNAPDTTRDRVSEQSNYYQHFASRHVGLGSPAAADLPWDIRRTGSAAVECAFVAAGLLDVARFDSPHVWDVAGGLALVAASGGVALAQGTAGWETLESFGGDGTGEMRDWQSPVILGRPEAVETLRSRLE